LARNRSAAAIPPNPPPITTAFAIVFARCDIDSTVAAKKVKERPWIGAAVIALATLLAYIPAIRGGFIWDDPDHVINNPTLRNFSGLVEMWTNPHSLPQWYPLVHTTFWVEYHVWRLDPLGYHVVNVLMHIGVALLLWRVLLVLEVPGAWFAGAIFALHPVHVESVAWITERKNVLSGALYFLAFLSYLKWTGSPKQWKWYGAALALFVAALLSKSVTATLPAAILVIVWWKRGSIGWRDIRRLIPFFVIGIAAGLLTAHLEIERVGATGQRIAEFNLTFGQRLVIAGGAVWFYLSKLLFPWPLVFIYPKWAIDTSSWFWRSLPAAWIIVLVLLGHHRNRIGRGPLTAGLLFVGTLFPALGFVNVYPMRFSFIADHFQYLASAAVIALLAARISYLAAAARAVMYSIVLCFLGVLTWNQCHIYQDSETLWRDTLAHNPRSWMVHVNLGDAVFDRYQRTRDPAALAEAREHYLLAVKLEPDLWETNFPAGLALVAGDMKQDGAKAMQYFERTVELNPDFARGWYCIGQIYQLWGNRYKAIENYQKAADLGSVEARQRLDLLLTKP
jgi:hypothetical protein